MRKEWFLSAGEVCVGREAVVTFNPTIVGNVTGSIRWSRQKNGGTMESIGVYTVATSTARFDLSKITSAVEVVDLFNLRFPSVSKEDAGLYRVSLTDAISANNNTARIADATLMVKG